MVKTITVDEVVAKISEFYRRSKKNAATLRIRIEELESILQDELILHRDYKYCQEELETKKQELAILEGYNMGVYDCREIFMDLW